jgi:biotin operon repressor
MDAHVTLTSKPPPHLALLSAHMHVLCLLLQSNGSRQSEVAQLLGLTARTTSRIIQQLRQAGYITAVRGSSRRNFYTVCLDHRLQHPLERGPSVGELVQLFVHAAKPCAVTAGSNG